MTKQAQEIRDAAASEAEYHVNEIMEFLFPDETIRESTREDMRRRLMDAFYSGRALTLKQAEVLVEALTMIKNMFAQELLDDSKQTAMLALREWAEVTK